MSTGKRVAVVTGSNKGIGFGAVRGLCKQFDGDVFLTARNEKLGQEAVKALNSEGLQPKFHQLDICDKASIDRLKNFLQTTYGGLDVLVNNAGISFPPSAPEPFPVQAEVNIKTNFRGPLDVCKGLFPLLRPHARVVNVSTRFSHMNARKCSDTVKDKLTDPSITVQELEQLMTEFVSAAKQGTCEAQGWPEAGYAVAKIGIAVMSIAHQREFDKDSREDIVVNACCPGYTGTDMTSHKGHKTIDEGADTLVYLALLPPNTTSPKGSFVAERIEMPFKGPDFPVTWN